MMAKFSSNELAEWAGCDWAGVAPEEGVDRVSHDSRCVRPGDLYVAIEGESFDGHRFVEQAREKGAVAALVRNGFELDGFPMLQVPDTLKGLQALAQEYRKLWRGKTVGITGSVGKTTVKEMCAEVLSMQGETHRTAGNWNNHIGLPLSMLAHPREAAFGVFEMGMSHPGEIEELAAILRPDVAVLTEICNAHRESFGALEGIALEKAMLPAAVSSEGWVVLDADGEWFDLIRQKTTARVVTVSWEGSGDYVGRKVRDQVLDVRGYEYAVPLPGDHMLRNALRAIAVGLEFGLVPEQIAEGLARFQNAPMRWQEQTLSGILFINDAYNANPLSMRASLRTFAEQSLPGKKWAVLGGMRELGAAEDEEHAALGNFIDTLKLDGVIAMGPLAAKMKRGGAGGVQYCANVEEATQILKGQLAVGDRVLLKASRGERLEQVLDFFRES